MTKKQLQQKLNKLKKQNKLRVRKYRLKQKETKHVTNINTNLNPRSETK